FPPPHSPPCSVFLSVCLCPCACPCACPSVLLAVRLSVGLAVSPPPALASLAYRRYAEYPRRHTRRRHTRLLAPLVRAVSEERETNATQGCRHAKLRSPRRGRGRRIRRSRGSITLLSLARLNLWHSDDRDAQVLDWLYTGEPSATDVFSGRSDSYGARASNRRSEWVTEKRVISSGVASYLPLAFVRRDNRIKRQCPHHV
ncbi:unnamed protein product, partial [Scytosiphon promiscuus]